MGVMHRRAARRALHNPVWARFLTLALAACLALVLGGQPAPGQAPERYALSPGDSVVVNVDFEVADIIIGASDVASAVPLSRNSFVIQARTIGQTAIIVLNGDKSVRRQFRVTVRESYADLEQVLNELDPGNRITVRNINQRVLLRGTVRGENQRVKALQTASSYSDAPVLESLKVINPRQILLKVNVLELSRSGGKDLGISAFGNAANYEALNGAAFGSANATLEVRSSLLGNFDVDFLLQALEVKGLAKRLANPTLVSVNGAPASFVVGGEVPITSAVYDENGDPTGASQTDYREYGVKLGFTPYIMDDNTVRLEITPEVSEVDWNRRVDDNPAFVTRKVTTTVELTSGSSFAIAGLLQQNRTRSVSQVPWLADLPILGALFRSAAYQNNETELVVIVTPVLVGKSSSELDPVNPLATSGEVMDSELFLFGLVESNRALVKRFKTGVGAEGPYGHILPKR